MTSGGGRIWRRALLGLGLLAVVFAGPLAGAAQQVPTVADGVFTVEQAARGRQGYVVFCAHCHASDLSGDNSGDSGAYPLRRDGFMAGSSAGALFQKMRDTMPLDAPGALSDQQYADIEAFLFEQNGFPAGETELPADFDTLNEMMIVARDVPR